MFIKNLLPVDEPSLQIANGKSNNSRWAVDFKALDEETLIIDIYRNVGEKVTRFLPEIRVFEKKDEYLTYVFEESRWSGSSIERASNIYYYGKTEEYNSDIAKHYLDKWEIAPGENQIGRIYYLQSDLMELRRKKKNKKEADKIDAEMSKFKDRLTKPMEKFLIKDVFKGHNFIFFNKKEKKAYCTHCEADVLFDNTYRHNKEGICPTCKTKVTYKSQFISHKYLDVRGTGVIFEQSKDGQLLARYFDIFKSYKDYKNPYIYKREVVRTVFEEKKPVNYEWRDFHQTGTRWCVCKPHQAYYSGGYPYHSDDIRYVANSIYAFYGTGCIEKTELFKNSEAKAWSKYSIPSAWGVENYLEEYLKCSLLERFAKLGMFSLACEFARWDYKDINLKEKEMHKILGITKDKYRILASVTNPSPSLYKCLKSNNTRKVYTKEEYEFVNSVCKSADQMERTFNLLNIVSYKKFSRYIRDKEVDMYLDYIDMCRKLKWDLKNSFVLFPKNLKAAHDEAMTLYKDKKEAINLRAINELLPKIAEKFEFEFKDLVIIVPKDAKEYIKESQTLHNCISRNYMNKMADMKCYIVFIRKADAIDKPYFAMEISKDLEVVQVRGMNNCSANEEVKECVDAYKEKVLKAA